MHMNVPQPALSARTLRPQNAGAKRNLLFSNLSRGFIGQMLLILVITGMQALSGGGDVLLYIGQWLTSLFAPGLEPLASQIFLGILDTDTRSHAVLWALPIGFLGLYLRSRRLGDRSVHPALAIFIACMVAVGAWTAGILTVPFIVMNLINGYTEKFDHEFTPPWWAKLPIVRDIIR